MARHKLGFTSTFRGMAILSVILSSVKNKIYYAYEKSIASCEKQLLHMATHRTSVAEPVGFFSGSSSNIKNSY